MTRESTRPIERLARRLGFGTLSDTGQRTQFAAVAVLALLVVGFVVVLALRAYDSRELAAATAEQASAAPPVDVATVKAAGATNQLTLPGETAAWYEATIYARVDGYVGKWFVDIGDQVKEGQVLASIETPDLDAQLSVAQAKLKSAQADVQVREAKAAFAESTYQRWKDSPKGVVSEQETEDKKAGYESAKAELLAARAQVNLAQGEVDRLNAFEKFKQVTAPFTGVITQRHIDIGNLVTAGSSSSTTPLYRMTQNDPIRVFVDVPQDAASAMKAGTPVDVVTNGGNGQKFSGTIARTATAVDPQARTMRAEVDIPNATGALVPGLYVETAFHLRAEGASAEVPAAAMIFRSKGPQVAVVSGDHVELRSVAIAEDNGNTVKLASGVKPGEQVVLNISSQIGDGDKVQVSLVDGHSANAKAADAKR